MADFRFHVVSAFRSDLDAWRANGWTIRRGPLGAAKAVFHFNGLRATLVYRLAHWARLSRIPVLPTALHQLNVALHGVEIPPTVPVGHGLYMPHSVGSVIFAESIGAGVTLQGGITLGLREDPRFPVIEDGVFLAAGCRVLGPVTIGAHATVGANAVVLGDVPAFSTAVGVPARIIPPRQSVEGAAAG